MVLGTRTLNLLAQLLECKPDAVTPEAVTALSWRDISGQYNVGRAAMRDIRLWMNAAGYTWHPQAGWKREPVTVPEEYSGNIELRLPTETLAGVQRIATFADVPVETVIRVILAIEVQRQIRS